MEAAALDTVPPPPPVGASPGQSYRHLAERAGAFIREHGGAAPEDALIHFVFGGAGSVALWRPLLRQLLAEEEQLILRADGRWALTSTAAPVLSCPIADFVAIDVETTGLHPSRQRIIEVAVIRYEGGAEVERFVSYCQPERGIPDYIARLTGITNEDVADAPLFRDVVDDIVCLTGDRLLIGHNVGFDIGFLNAELDRCGRSKLINERLDTMTLATRLLTGVRKPGLHTIAKTLSIPSHSRRAHRAAADASLTAEVALRLAALATEQGLTTIDQLKALQAPKVRRGADRRGNGRSVLDRSLLADIPKRPGVYLMRDAFGTIIYIGKAKNLRDRVSSYYSQPLGYTRKMDGLLEAIARIDVEVVGNELDALMLEAQLIRRYQPRYNTALRAHEHYPFIRVDIANAWPRVTLAKSRRDDGARYFGPFRSTTSARKTVDLINRIIPLRTCTRSFRDARSYGAPCLELDLGRCLGPCVAKADRDIYMGLVRNVVTFLEGQDDVLYEMLWRGLEDAAEKLDFERAARIRHDLSSVTTITAAQRRLRAAMETAYMIIVLPAPEPAQREVVLVAHGRVWSRIRAGEGEDYGILGTRLAASWERLHTHGAATVDHDSLDEANLLGRWLSVNAGHPAIIAMPAAGPAAGWNALAEQIFRTPLHELIFDQRAVDEVEAGQDGAAPTEAEARLQGSGSGLYSSPEAVRTVEAEAAQ